MRVTVTSILICYVLKKLGIKVKLPIVVVGALCHDLGMLGRAEKYESDKECHREHPKESVIVAQEILEDLPEVDAVLVPIGGGGLISGVATAIKESRPKTRVIGVQAAASAAYYESRKAGHCVGVEPAATVADGLSCRRASEGPFSVMEHYVDEIVTVEEEEICEAVRFLANKAKLISEPSACVGLAALLYGKVKVKPEDNVGTVLSAGNWNIEDIGHILIGDEVKGVH